jgi:hypothetical protein
LGRPAAIGFIGKARTPRAARACSERASGDVLPTPVSVPGDEDALTLPRAEVDHLAAVGVRFGATFHAWP